MERRGWSRSRASGMGLIPAAGGRAVPTNGRHFTRRCSPPRCADPPGPNASFTLRPPRDVPSVAPAPSQTLIPPSGNVAPPATKGPLLQSPATNLGTQAHAAPSAPAALAVPPGQGALAVSARFGRDL